MPLRLAYFFFSVCFRTSSERYNFFVIFKSVTDFVQLPRQKCITFYRWRQWGKAIGGCEWLKGERGKTFENGAHSDPDPHIEMGRAKW